MEEEREVDVNSDDNGNGLSKAHFSNASVCKLIMWLMKGKSEDGEVVCRNASVVQFKMWIQFCFAKYAREVFLNFELQKVFLPHILCASGTLRYRASEEDVRLRPGRG